MEVCVIYQILNYSIFACVCFYFKDVNKDPVPNANSKSQMPRVSTWRQLRPYRKEAIEARTNENDITLMYFKLSIAKTLSMRRFLLQVTFSKVKVYRCVQKSASKGHNLMLGNL